jgi:zinc protease
MKRVLVAPTLSLTVAVVFSGCAHHPSEARTGEFETLPFVGTFKVNRAHLENGLTLLVVEDHSSPTFAYNTWFNVGSRNEKPSYTGLAHLFEHLMFKGTTNHPEGEFDRLLEAAGAEGENAFTSRDYTAYVQELPRGKLDLIARLESDRMVHLIVNDQSFKTEREVVQNERRYRNENSPEGLMYQEIFGLAFKVHPYHWPVIGYAEDLERMTSETPREFYKAYYNPEHATVVVVGDVDPDEVLDTIKKYYGSIPRQPSPPPLDLKGPPQKSPRRKVLHLNIQVDKLLVAYHVPAVASEDTAAVMATRSVLTGGKSSRLSRALVDTGIASSVDTYDLDDKDPSLLIIAVSLQKGKRAALAESVIQREVRKLMRKGLTEQELQRAKNILNFSFYEGLSSDSEKANFLGRYSVLAGDFQLGLKQFDQIQKVTPADVQRIAKIYLEPKNRSVIVGQPKKGAAK